MAALYFSVICSWILFKAPCYSWVLSSWSISWSSRTATDSGDAWSDREEPCAAAAIAAALWRPSRLPASLWAHWIGIGLGTWRFSQGPPMYLLDRSYWPPDPVVLPDSKAVVMAVWRQPYSSQSCNRNLPLNCNDWSTGASAYMRARCGRLVGRMTFQ